MIHDGNPNSNASFSSIQVTKWSCDNVCEWLESIGLSEYKAVFLENHIEGDILVELDDETLKNDLGVRSLGHRHRMEKEIKKLMENTRDNVIDLLVLHAAPLVIRDKTNRIYPMEKLDLETERRAIVNSLLNEIRHKAIRIRFDVATADTLRSLMTAYRCRVLHFSGHGLGQNPALCFEDGVGCTQLIHPEMLRQLTFAPASAASAPSTLLSPSSSSSPARPMTVAEVVASSGPAMKPINLLPGSSPSSSLASGLQLVFVNSCHSEKVASIFVKAGIAHVIAVHSDSLVIDESATMFAKHFYLSLFCGHTVDAAFEIAKCAVRSLPMRCRAACCCAHAHEKNCPWVQQGSRHSNHSPKSCCCKGSTLVFPHDESSKFVLLGASNHRVALFENLPSGPLRDLTPKCKSFIPSMHGQFVGRNTEMYVLMRSLSRESVTVCLGAPGIGKSSLVISIAHYVHERRMFPDGVFYVDLEGLQLSAVRYAIAQSMGIRGADSDDEVFAEFGSWRCLIVMDKVEELLDQDEAKCQELLSNLISIAPCTRLLLASRRIPEILKTTANSYSLTELPLRTATELLRLAAPRCSQEHAARLAQICGCLPLAIRVVGRALANARTSITPEAMIEALEARDGRFQGIKGLNQAGQHECIDRCIRSSFSHLEETIRFAFMALGFFRGSFDAHAANAVLCHVSSSEEALGSSNSSSSGNLASIVSGRAPTSGSSTSSFFPAFAFARQPQRPIRSSRLLDEESSHSSLSLGSQLCNMDDFGFDFDSAMTDDGYDLLDVESSEEIEARKIAVADAKVALEVLNQWSLIEYDRKTCRYRMHNLVQLFAEDEANRLEEDELLLLSTGNGTSQDNKDSSETSSAPKAPFRLGRSLLLTWKRRFVRFYCMTIAEASHTYRFDGSLALFDRERPNIESALRVGRELCSQSVENMREARQQIQLQEQTSLDYDLGSSNDSISPVAGDSSPRPRQRLESRESSTDDRELTRSASVCSSSTMTTTAKSLRDCPLVDALLYCNLVVRCRFLHRARDDPRTRFGIYSACLRLSRETRALHCTCGCKENKPELVLWEVEDLIKATDMSVLDTFPTFETTESQKNVKCCGCVGIKELIAMEALLLLEMGYAAVDLSEGPTTAECYYLESLRLQREVLGRRDHAQVAEVLNLMGVSLSTRSGLLAHNVWLLVQAERFLKAAMYMRARVLGDAHPEYASSLNNLANFYKTSGSLIKRPYRKKRNQGRKLSYAAVLKSEPKKPDSSSSNGTPAPTIADDKSATSSNSSVFDEDSEDELPDVEQLYRKSLQIREETLGRSHPQVAQSLNNLAGFLARGVFESHQQDKELLEEVSGLYKRALSIRREMLGNSSYETAATLNNLGNFKRSTKDYEEAEKYFLEALAIQQRYFKDKNRHSGRIFFNLGRMYMDQERYDDALDAFENSKAIREQLFPGSREVGYVLEMIGKCMRAKGDEEEGLRIEEQGKKMKLFGLLSDQAESKDPSQRKVSVSTQLLIGDFIEQEALELREFCFPERLLGRRGIHIKKIEAVAGAQVRYEGIREWHTSNGRRESHSRAPGRESSALSTTASPSESVEPVRDSLSIAATSEEALEKAKQLCIDHLRKMKSQWEQFVARQNAYRFRPPRAWQNTTPPPASGSAASSSTPPIHRNSSGNSTRNYHGTKPNLSNNTKSHNQTSPQVQGGQTSSRTQPPPPPPPPPLSHHRQPPSRSRSTSSTSSSTSQRRSDSERDRDRPRRRRFFANGSR